MSITRAQKINLVNYMLAHRPFARGVVDPVDQESHVDHWNRLRDMLKHHGPDKTVAEWETVRNFSFG